MSQNRVYVPFMMHGVRIVNLQHVWQPSTEYLGKPQDKPSWFTTVISPKTRANWWEEPALANCWAAYSELLSKSGMTPQHVTEWPIRDGDMPPEPGKTPAEWAKGHWVFGGSTNSPIKVEMVQGQAVVPLLSKQGVKPGDFVSLGLSAAIKQNNVRALKHFCNTILFTAPGEEIAVGNSVSGAELMAAAQAQGLSPVGFQSAPGGFAPSMGGMPGPGGFAPPMGAPQHPGVPQPGFTPPPTHGPAGYVHGSPTANLGQPGSPAMPPAPGQFATPGAPMQPGSGNVTFPSNPAGAPMQPGSGNVTFPSNPAGAPGLAGPSAPQFPAFNTGPR